MLKSHLLDIADRTWKRNGCVLVVIADSLNSYVEFKGEDSVYLRGHGSISELKSDIREWAGL